MGWIRGCAPRFPEFIAPHTHPVNYCSQSWQAMKFALYRAKGSSRVARSVVAKCAVNGVNFREKRPVLPLAHDKVQFPRISTPGVIVMKTPAKYQMCLESVFPLLLP
jgi:hypothetical protein